MSLEVIMSQEVKMAEVAQLVEVRLVVALMELLVELKWVED
jgi:hypothetical protein